MNTRYELPQDVVISALTEAARLGLPHDIQELLLHGNVDRGIPPNILPNMLLAAIQRHEITADLPSQPD